MAKYVYVDAYFDKTRQIPASEVAGTDEKTRQRIMSFSEAPLLRAKIRNAYARNDRAREITTIFPFNRDGSKPREVAEIEAAIADSSIFDKNNSEWWIYGHNEVVKTKPYIKRYASSLPAKPANPATNTGARKAIKAGEIMSDENGKPIIFNSIEVFCQQYKDLDDHDENGNPKLKYLEGNEPEMLADTTIRSLFEYVTDGGVGKGTTVSSPTNSSKPEGTPPEEPDGEEGFGGPVDPTGQGRKFVTFSQKTGKPLFEGDDLNS